MTDTTPIYIDHEPADGHASFGPYALVVTTPDGTTSFPILPGRTYTIGRRRTSDIFLFYPFVSNDHATVYGGDPPVLVDQQSRNGTSIGGRRLVPGVRQELHDGHTISIGSISIRVRRDPEGAFRVDETEITAVEIDAQPATRSTSGRALRRPVTSGHWPVTRNPAMVDLYTLAEQVAACNVSVFILGETGVGKEVLARAIHDNGGRAGRRLITVNCAAIPENLVESELFGYEKGAFSGAHAAKPGLFEAADGGTLFLDEVGELPRTVQAKLLRVIETGEVPRIGAVRPRRVDVRILSATNRDIQSEIAAGAFRADLYYRLNGMTLTIPPLRERPEDIPALAFSFARKYAGGGEPRFTAEALAALQLHAFPGNVRELKTVVERAVLLARGGDIDVGELLFDPPPASRSGHYSALVPTRTDPSLGGMQTPDDTVTFSRIPVAPRYESDSRIPAAPRYESESRIPIAPRYESDSRMPASSRFDSDSRIPVAPRSETDLTNEVAAFEAQKIRSALEKAGGNQTDAAKLLGISRRTLINRLEQYGIARPRKRG